MSLFPYSACLRSLGEGTESPPAAASSVAGGGILSLTLLDMGAGTAVLTAAPSDTLLSLKLRAVAALGVSGEVENIVLLSSAGYPLREEEQSLAVAGIANGDTLRLVKREVSLTLV